MKSIKGKLVAATCMLLVSCIMVVSSTYAWFTLSTAPEVTGIQTAVGANGNLEMALLPKAGPNTEITSQAGDSVKDALEKNITWGNLVDLSNTDAYGLDKITLFPAALNINEAGKLDTSALLMTPAYGSDGRVSELLKNTMTSHYDSVNKNFMPNSEYGVRAVGTAAGMSERQLEYRNARSAANTAMAQAKNMAASSLNNNGDALANVAIKKATSDSPTFTAADVASLQAIVDDLLGKDGNTGVLDYIENAYVQYIYAYIASAKNTANDDAWKATRDSLDGKSLAEIQTAVGTAIPSTVAGYIEKLEETRSEVQSANSKLAALAGETNVTWDQISPALTLLADTNNMEVNGIKVSDIKNNMSTLVNGVAGSGLTVTMKSGGGVYADIADHCGDYTASVVIEEVTYNGITLNNMTAKMTTKTSENTVYLVALGGDVELAGAPSSTGGTSQPITDMYGYVIDLAFRTNATESDLKLQVKPADRIYSDNTNDTTMGHGSSMTF
ncbi:MAG: hypothetical protein IJM99_08385, partial [Firmicutes bacterium]|nr:hypothetical protein [Bacillota bacterium]